MLGFSQNFTKLSNFTLELKYKIIQVDAPYTAMIQKNIEVDDAQL